MSTQGPAADPDQVDKLDDEARQSLAYCRALYFSLFGVLGFWVRALFCVLAVPDKPLNSQSCNSHEVTDIMEKWRKTFIERNRQRGNSRCLNPSLLKGRDYRVYIGVYIRVILGLD